MPTMKVLITVAALLISVLNLSGCASSKNKSVLPTEGKTMYEIYQDKTYKTNTESLDNIRKEANSQPDVIPTDGAEYAAYSRSSSNELKALFPKLPNPTIVMYMYPHLAGSDEAPVPGYVTQFNLYKEDHYALPDEIPPYLSRDSNAISRTA